MKKYQLGGAAKVAKKMSKLMKPVKTGVAKTTARPARIVDTGKYIKNKDIKKGMSTKPLTKKYSKVMKKEKAIPSKKYTTYGSSPIEKTINKSKNKLNFVLSKKIRNNFSEAQYNYDGLYGLEKRKLPKPKMVKGGSLRRTIKHK